MVRDRIVEEMSATPQHVMAGVWDGVLSFDGEAAAAACRVPTLYVGAARIMADLDRFRALCPQLVTGQAVGAGHFLQLLAPDQVNAMIDRFLTIAIPTPAPVA